jgi:exosortase K
MMDSIGRKVRRGGWRAAVLVMVGLGLWALKRHYAQASVEGLAFILAPTAKLVELVSGVHFEFEPGSGYLSREHLFALAKPCAGVNFMVAAWGMLGFVLSRRARNLTTSARTFFASLALSYLAAVLVNAVRVLIAMPLAAHPFVSHFWTAARVHRVEGIVVYFGGLALLHAVALRRAPVAGPSSGSHAM